MDKSIFWQHLIECKISNIEQFNFKSQLYYSLKSGFSTDESNDDLFLISQTIKNKYRYHEDVYDKKYFISFDTLNEEFLNFAKLYLPLLLAKFISKEKPFIIVHFAQTLDGKIATVSGKSKWISNEENLDHAHRLRALADGVLVGGSTIKEDFPQLTVRRVEGKNPCRIFWCNSINDFSAYQSQDAATYLIRNKKNSIENKTGIDEIVLYEEEEHAIDEVLIQLKKLGIHSVFVEGGSYTISQFYKAKAIDFIQIHIAPILFGSGKNAVEVDAIVEVEDAMRMDGRFIRSINHVMFVGKPIFK